MQFSTTPDDFYQVNYGSADSALVKLTEEVRKFVDEKMQEALAAASTNFTAVTTITANTNQMICRSRPNEAMLVRAIIDVVNGLTAAGFSAHTTSFGRDSEQDMIVITIPATDPNQLPQALTDRETELLNKLEELVCNAPKAVPRMSSTAVFESAKELVLKYHPDFKTPWEK
jgi:hypothetical protein